MTDTAKTPPRLTARVEATIGGKIRTSTAIPFTLAGVTLIAHSEKAANGDQALTVTASAPPSPGVARFEKTCFETVTFTLFDGDVPIHQSDLKSVFQGTTVELVG